MSRPPIKALLLDLSGTLHVGSTPTPRALPALHRLRASSIPFRFCSNTSKESTAELVGRLVRMGFEVDRNGGEGGEVWTSVGAVRRVIGERGLRNPYFVLSPSAIAECASSLPSSPSSAPHDAVIIGLAPPLLDYPHLNTAFQILTSPSPSPSTVPLLATHKAKYIRTPDPSRSLSLGPGPFVTALEHASGVTAEVMGKPSRAFFEAVLGSLGLDEGEEGKVVVIGDDVEADLGGGAVELGFWRVLVKTGKYRPGDESKPGVHPPDEVADSFASWVDDLLDSR